MCCARRRAVWAFARSLINHVGRGDLFEPGCRLLKAALVAVHEIDLDKAIAILKGIGPRPVIDDGPIVIAPAFGALGDCLGNPLQVLAHKVDSVVILDGSFGVFVGPIYDNEGNLRVEEGQTLTPEEILAIDWFVEGITLV